MNALIHNYYNLNKDRKTLVSSPVTNTSKRRKDHDRRPWQFYGPISMIWLAEIGQLCVVTNGADKSCFGLIVNPYANNKTCSIVWVFSLIATNVARANTRRVLFFPPVCTMYAVVFSLAFFGLVQGVQHRDILDLYKYRYHGNVSD